MKPNHLCKNIDCKKGVDEHGNPCRKRYYACDYCDWSGNKRAVSCCDECFEAYMRQVAKARSKNQVVHIYPERLDKSKDEVQKIYKRSAKEIKESTLKELSDYKEDIETIGLAKTIDKINQQ